MAVPLISAATTGGVPSELVVEEIELFGEDVEEQGAMAVPGAGGIGMGLDSKTGQNGGLFVSPDGRSVDLSYWSTRGGGHRLELGIDADEGPSLEMRRGGERVLRLPRPESDESGEGDDE